MDLKNSTILITGGTSGIGLEFVKQLTEQGAKMIITGRNIDALNETKKKFPKVHTFQSDVSNPQEIRQLYEDVIQQFPELNIVINNAGIMREIDLKDKTLDLENINLEIATNLSGTIQMVHQFLPHLSKQKTSAIVNVSSGIAFMPYSIAPIYSASKAGVRAYTRALRLQLEETNVKVFEVIPPGVDTPLEKDWTYQNDKKRFMKVDKMVKVAVKGILKDQFEIKGGIAKMAKTMSRIAPDFAPRIAHGAFKKFMQLNKQK